MATTATKRTGRAAGNEGLGDAIKARVADLGTTMDRASIDLGLSPNALSRWNTGIEPTPAYYGVLMDFLGVTLAELGALIVEDQLRRSGLPRP